MMRIHLWGTDFRRGTPELRKALYVAPEERLAKIQSLIAAGFQDLVYLVTCNRVEFYTTAKDPFCDTRALWRKLLTEFNLDDEAFYSGYHFEGKAAIRHLMRVASSLESMVVGEPQILGQLKESLSFSRENNLPLDASLERCFSLCFEVAKRVRTETQIAERPVSVGTLGLHYLQSHEQNNPLKKVTIVGRSPIVLHVIDWLKKNRPGTPLLWANRHLDKIANLPEAQGVELMPLADFLGAPPAFSHLFTATSSREPLFEGDFFAKAMTGDSKVLAFDFAEPQDIASGVGKDDPRLTIIHIDDLKEEANNNRALRAISIQQAEEIIDSAIKQYFLQQKQAPLMREFNAVEPSFVESLAAALSEVERDLPSEFHPKVRRLAESLVKRNLHLSREHLRGVLQKVTDPEVAADAVSPAF